MTDPVTDTLSSKDTFKKILIPVVRKILPSIIATDIVGVQQMSGPSGLIFSVKPKFGIKSSAHTSPNYDDWLIKNGMPNNSSSVKIYIEALLE